MNPKSERGRWIREILERYQSPLIRYALRLVGDEEQARDIVQDTFLKLCREEPSRVQGHIAEWLYTVTRNRAFDVRRKESRMTGLSEAGMASLPSTDRDPAAKLQADELAGRVLELVGALPEKQQEVVRLKFQSGLRYREISKITGLSVSNVGFLIHTAVQTVRKQMMSELASDLNKIRRIR